MSPERFRAIRKGGGLTLAALAEKLRVSDGRTVRRWESGEREVSGPVAILMEMIEAGRF